MYTKISSKFRMSFICFALNLVFSNSVIPVVVSRPTQEYTPGYVNYALIERVRDKFSMSFIINIYSHLYLLFQTGAQPIQPLVKSFQAQRHHQKLKNSSIQHDTNVTKLYLSLKYTPHMTQTWLHVCYFASFTYKICKTMFLISYCWL